MVDSMRRVVIDNKEIFDLQMKKQKMVVDLKEMQADIDKIVEKIKVMGGKIQNLKDKSIPKMQVVVDGLELKRTLTPDCPNCHWEVVDSFQIEGDELVLYIVDVIDRQKETIQEELDKENEAKTETSETPETPNEESSDNNS